MEAFGLALRNAGWSVGAGLSSHALSMGVVDDITKLNISTADCGPEKTETFDINDADLVCGLLFLGTENDNEDTIVKNAVIRSALGTLKDKSGNPYLKSCGAPPQDVTQFLERARNKGYLVDKKGQSKGPRLLKHQNNKKENSEVSIDPSADRALAGTWPYEVAGKLLSRLVYLLFEGARHRFQSQVDDVEEKPDDKNGGGKRPQKSPGNKKPKSPGNRRKTGSKSDVHKNAGSKNPKEGRSESTTAAGKNVARLRRRVLRFENIIPGGSPLDTETTIEFITKMNCFDFGSKSIHALVYIYCCAYQEDNLELLEELDASVGFIFIHHKHTAIKYLEHVSKLSKIPVPLILDGLRDDLFEEDLLSLKAYACWCEEPSERKDKLFRKMALLLYPNHYSSLSTKKSPFLCSFLQYVLKECYDVKGFVAEAIKNSSPTYKLLLHSIWLEISDQDD